MSPGRRVALDVVSPERPAQQGETPPGAVHLSEPMRRFRCNQRGCCCSGWDIPFRLEDVVRLHEHLPEAEREVLQRGVHLVVDAEKRGENGEAVLHWLKLDGVGEERACRFLDPGGSCRVHRTAGLAALPDLCVDFPSFGYRRADGEVELFFDPVCPEVLERLDEEAAGPLTLHRQEGPFGEPMMDLRVAHAAAPIAGRVGDYRISSEALEQLRRASLGLLAHPTRPISETLALLLDGFARLDPAREDGGGFSLRESVDPGPALRFLVACIGAHGAQLLARSLGDYRRFVFNLDLAPLLARRVELEQLLAGWQQPFARHLAPQEELLRPLTLRWLAHRFASPMVKARGELREAADSIVHIYGTALRFAAVLGALRDAPVGRTVFKVALGAAEQFHRSVHPPRESLPWFAARGPDDPAW